MRSARRWKDSPRPILRVAMRRGKRGGLVLQEQIGRISHSMRVLLLTTAVLLATSAPAQDKAEDTLAAVIGVQAKIQPNARSAGNARHAAARHRRADPRRLRSHHRLSRHRGRGDPSHRGRRPYRAGDRSPPTTMLRASPCCTSSARSTPSRSRSAIRARSRSASPAW
jgi:hypothetical protein